MSTSKSSATTIDSRAQSIFLYNSGLASSPLTDNESPSSPTTIESRPQSIFLCNPGLASPSLTDNEPSSSPATAEVPHNVEVITFGLDCLNSMAVEQDILTRVQKWCKDVVSVPIPRKLSEKGVQDMLRLSDGRMSGTAGGTIGLHISPESSYPDSVPDLIERLSIVQKKLPASRTTIQQTRRTRSLPNLSRRNNHHRTR